MPSDKKNIQARQSASNPVTCAMVALIVVSLVAACSQGSISDSSDGLAEKQDTSDTIDPGSLAPEMIESEIDWTAARSDFASQQADETDDTAFQTQSGGTLTPIPVLLPDSDTVTVQSGSSDEVAFRLLPDGYFASYPGERYSIVINGTNLIAGPSGDARNDRDGEMSFTITMSGAQVALSRYGADYLVEFECNITDPGTGTCITEDEAIQVAEDLIVAGTR